MADRASGQGRASLGAWGQVGLVADLLEVIDTVFVGDDDVEETVGVHVVDFELSADTAVVVEDMFGPNWLPATAGRGFAGELEPGDFRRLVFAGVAAVVGVVALAGDEVGEAVAVDI